MSCLQGPNDDVVLPKDSTKADWEAELGVVIGSTARYVEEREALEYVAGYVVVNDISEREYQVGMGKKPQPIYLKPGDRLRLGASRSSASRLRPCTPGDDAEGIGRVARRAVRIP